MLGLKTYASLCVAVFGATSTVLAGCRNAEEQALNATLVQAKFDDGSDFEYAWLFG